AQQNVPRRDVRRSLCAHHRQANGSHRSQGEPRANAPRFRGARVMQAPGDLLDRTLLELCAIPSPIGEEKELCDWVEQRMGKLPLASKIRRYSHSIVVPITRTGKPHVVLAGHLDTVRTENGPARIEGRRCFGSGASDMKSG